MSFMTSIHLLYLLIPFTVTGVLSLSQKHGHNPAWSASQSQDALTPYVATDSGLDLGACDIQAGVSAPESSQSSK